MKFWENLKKKIREHDEAVRRKYALHPQIETEEVLYCNRCEEEETFKRTKEGWRCSKCGHVVSDVYEAIDDEDNDTEETPPFF
jgi:PHP family Zn ribbon phosphoesterase